jgi:tetratricopeptide (TPR) repeat protein
MGDDKVTVGPERLTQLLVSAARLRQHQDFAGSLQLYMEILDDFGPTPDLLALIAVCYHNMDLFNPSSTGENHFRAVEWLDRAIGMAPDDALLHELLATTHWLGTMNYEQAAQEFRRAIQLAPHNTRILFGAAFLHGTPEEVVTLDEAILWLEMAVVEDPAEPQLHIGLARKYEEAGRSQDAQRQWAKALMCPKTPMPDHLEEIGRALGFDDESLEMP